MRSTENTTSILNTLSHIRLLPEDEQVIELNKMMHHIKKINNDKGFSSSYRKQLDKVKYLLISNGYEKLWSCYVTF